MALLSFYRIVLYSKTYIPYSVFFILSLPYLEPDLSAALACLLPTPFLEPRVVSLNYCFAQVTCIGVCASEDLYLHDSLAEGHTFGLEIISELEISKHSQSRVHLRSTLTKTMKVVLCEFYFQILPGRFLCRQLCINQNSSVFSGMNHVVQ